MPKKTKEPRTNPKEKKIDKKEINNAPHSNGGRQLGEPAKILEKILEKILGKIFDAENAAAASNNDRRKIKLENRIQFLMKPGRNPVKAVTAYQNVIELT